GRRGRRGGGPRGRGGGGRAGGRAYRAPRGGRRGRRAWRARGRRAGLPPRVGRLLLRARGGLAPGGAAARALLAQRGDVDLRLLWLLVVGVLVVRGRRRGGRRGPGRLLQVRDEVLLAGDALVHRPRDGGRVRRELGLVLGHLPLH